MVLIDMLAMVSYYCAIVILSIRRIVFQIFDFKYTVTLKPGLGSLKVNGTDTYRSATYDFLLTFHINPGLFRTVSEIDGDFGQKS